MKRPSPNRERVPEKVTWGGENYRMLAIMRRMIKSVSLKALTAMIL